jgi:hypothetical protein
VDSLGICLVGNEWGKGVDSPENHTTQEGALVIWTNTSGETSVGTLQTRENH